MSDEKAYQVLARKYRPQTFADLIGQEAMVRTLKNAFAADRIAHAFVMTGVRGVGKTTTARIIAKGLNCIGPDAPAREVEWTRPLDSLARIPNSSASGSPARSYCGHIWRRRYW